MLIEDPRRPLSPRAVPPALYAKYARSGPRYTSYPTAPQFSADFDAAAIRERWRASNAGRGGLSLYVHIPFCRQRCLYCGCFTEVCHNQETAASYVAALLAEAQRLLTLIDPQRPLQQLALGGGTPTFLSPELMAELIAGLKQRFSFDPQGERSIEIDPRSVDVKYLDHLTELGFNRFSFGVQDLDPQVQQAIGRVQDEHLIAALTEHLRRLGHAAVNFDLIYGLPLQTAQSFTRTIQRVAQLRPSRIALFGYAHVPWVSPQQQALERYELPTPGERMELFGLAFELLTAAGYHQIGMDHFALADDELIRALHSRSLTRNFMGYSTRRGLDLLALGASSISAAAGTFTQNVKETLAYINQAATETWVKGLIKTPEDDLRGEVILELMCNFYLDSAAIEAKYGIDFAGQFADALAELAPMAEDGLVEIGPGSIAVTELGRFFVRNICMPFDEYLKREAESGRYSRTV